MANIVALSGRMAFKIDTGETKNEKPVYKSVALSGVSGAADADILASVAEKISLLLPLPVEEISLQRTEILEV
jgi:hypothetical protein